MSDNYDYHAKIISRHRITIPDNIYKEWDLKEGEKLYVVIKRPVRHTRDVIING